MRRQNPYDLGRGEFPVSVLDTGAGTFLLTTKRVYQLHTSGGLVGDVTTSKFQPIEIERPKIRKVTP